MDPRDIVGRRSWNEEWIRIMGMGSTSDGGFVVTGDVTWSDGWITDYDAWVAKFDANMNFQWGRVMGTGNYEGFTSVFQATDGNIVVVGTPFNEIYVAKLNVTNGNIIWQRRYPRTYYNSGNGKFFTWAKPSSDGGIIIADVIGSPGNDVGIDVVESSNYYYVAGLWNNFDLFYAKFDKNNCNLVGSVRYILSSGYEFARAIDIRPASGIPYMAGSTDRDGWTAGGYDGLLAADSGLQDTCYWRSLTPTTNVSVSLSASGSYTDYGNQLSVSSASYSSISVSTSKSIACGLLTPVNNDERYEDCYISISKEKQDIYIRLYSVNGKLVYDRFLKEFVGDLDERIKLSRGVYIAKVKYGVRELNRKFIVR